MSFSASGPAGGVAAAKPAGGGGGGLCIFDIDNTIMRGPRADPYDCGVTKAQMPMHPACKGCSFPNERPANGDKNAYPSPFAREAVKTCLARGFNVAVATAERCADPHRHPLSTVESRYDIIKGVGFGNDVLTKDNKRGPGLMCADHSNHGDKGVMVKKLIKTYGADPKKTLFWDDDWRFRADVRKANPDVTIGKASTSCYGRFCPEGCGILKSDFDKAWKRMEERSSAGHSSHSHHHHRGHKR